MNAGFSLIELVVVLVVLGFLSAMALPRMIATEEKSIESMLKGTASAVHSAAELIRARAVIEGATRFVFDQFYLPTGEMVVVTAGYPNFSSFISGPAYEWIQTPDKATYKWVGSTTSSFTEALVFDSRDPNNLNCAVIYHVHHEQPISMRVDYDASGCP